MGKSFIARGERGFWSPDFDLELIVGAICDRVDGGEVPHDTIPGELLEQWRWQRHGAGGMLELGLDRLGDEQAQGLQNVLRELGHGLRSGESSGPPDVSYWRQRLGHLLDLVTRLMAQPEWRPSRLEYMNWIVAHPPPSDPEAATRAFDKSERIDPG